MRLSLKRTDKDYYGVSEYILPVVNVAANYDKFIQIMCEILNTFNTFSADLVNKVKKTLELEKYKINEDDETVKAAYKLFADGLVNFYWNVVDTEFAKEAKKFDQDLYEEDGLRYEDCRLRRYRGLLFEALIDALVRNRFQGKGKRYETGCEMRINGTLILARYGYGNSRHKKTLDIVGWDEKMQYGEFYECKINPKRFENSNYRFFMEIKKALDAERGTKYILALASADATRNLKAQKECLEEEDPACHIDFELIGREAIFNISQYAIPEIA